MPTARLSLAVLLALDPLAAMAEVCAGAADLGQGIIVSYAGGGHDTFTADPRRPGVVVLEGEIQGRSLGTVELGQGYVYLSATGPEGQRVSYDYDILPADLPLPVPGGEWETVAVVSADGASSTERQTHRFGPEGTLAIGACIWPLVEVTTAYPGNTETRYWFPDLGLSVRAGDRVTAITPLALAP